MQKTKVELKIVPKTVTNWFQNGFKQEVAKKAEIGITTGMNRGRGGGCQKLGPGW